MGNAAEEKEILAVNSLFMSRNLPHIFSRLFFVQQHPDSIPKRMTPAPRPYYPVIELSCSLARACLQFVGFMIELKMELYDSIFHKVKNLCRISTINCLARCKKTRRAAKRREVARLELISAAPPFSPLSPLLLLRGPESKVEASRFLKNYGSKFQILRKSSNYSRGGSIQKELQFTIHVLGNQTNSIAKGGRERGE